MIFALKRAAAFSFLLLAASLPWSIAPISIAVVLCGAMTFAVWWGPGGERWVHTPIDWPAVVWLVALVIATATSMDPSESAGRITKGLLFAVVPIATYHGRDPKLARRALALLLASSAIAAIYALVKFAAQGGAFPVRVRGAVGHPITYGGQSMLLTILGGALLLRSRDRRMRIAAGVLLTLIVPALLGSYTRSAWIGALVGFIVLVGFTRARWLPGLAALIAVLVLLLPPGYRERAASVFDPKSHWNVERLILWDAGRRIFLDHWATGVGLQDLRPLVERYRSPQAHEPPHGHLHNVYLQVAATMGLVGLAAFSAVVVGLYRTAGRGIRNDLRGPPDELGLGIRLAAVAALTGFLVAGLFEWNFGDEELLHLLFTLVGMAYAASGWRRAWPDAQRSS